MTLNFHPTKPPNDQPTDRPTNQTTDQPTDRPTKRPTKRPTDRLTNRATSRNRALLGKLIVSHLVMIFPIFYATSRVSTLFTKARHLSLSWAKEIRSILSMHLILSSRISRGVPSDLFCSGHTNHADIKLYYFLFYFTVVPLTALHTNEMVSTTANDTHLFYFHASFGLPETSHMMLLLRRHDRPTRENWAQFFSESWKKAFT